MKYELVFQLFQILVFQILAYLSIYHVSGMVSVEKDHTDTDIPKNTDSDTDPPSLILCIPTVNSLDYLLA